MDFIEEFSQFLSSNGLAGRDDIVPVPFTAGDPEAAEEQRLSLAPLAGKAVFVTEDRWRTQGDAVRARLLAHAGRFRQVYARNCAVRRVDRATAARFLAEAHSYGDALSRFRYGLFVERVTGEKGTDPFVGLRPPQDDSGVSLRPPQDDSGVSLRPPQDDKGEALRPSSVSLRPSSVSFRAERRNLWPVPGDLVAVATFSKARNRVVAGRRVRSHEWVRYASLPGVRVEGGMGKLLDAFVAEVRPEDVMTYADLEWSDGRAYRELGFALEGPREPVLFAVDPVTWERRDVKYVPDTSGMLFYKNFGSLKYRKRYEETD